jgi:hypothetical protein
MNCKPGDMALVIVGLDAGKTTTCVRLEDPDRCGVPYRGKTWRIEHEMHWSDQGQVLMLPYLPDSYLMPIRPEPDPLHVETDNEVKA